MENISTKEWMISIIVILCVISFAIYINPFLKDAMLDDVRDYQKSLQIDGDGNLFQYAQQTHAGNVLAYGTMKALSPMSIPELSETFGIIERVAERYTEHQRWVCDSHDDNGNCTGGHYESYYTWDTYGRDTFISNEFEFLSTRFQNAQLTLDTQFVLDLNQSSVTLEFLPKVHGHYIYKDSHWLGLDVEGDLRYYYKVLPSQFSCSMFVKFDGNFPKGIVFYEKNRVQVIQDKERSIVTFDWIYYLSWILVVGAGYYHWAYSYGDIR